MLKVIEKYRMDEDDCREFLEILVYDDDKKVKHLDFSDGEPEDNSLCRNFSDVHSITDLMKLAYEAGKTGKEFVYEYESEDEE